VRRRLSWIHSVLGRAIPGGWVPMMGMKVRSLVVFSNHTALHWWSTKSAARMLSSDEQMSCCATGGDGCLDLRCRAFPLGGQVSAEWSRCPGTSALHARDSVAPLRRSSAGWMPVRMGWLSAGVERSHPVTVRKVSLMTDRFNVEVKTLQAITRRQSELESCSNPLKTLEGMWFAIKKLFSLGCLFFS